MNIFNLFRKYDELRKEFEQFKANEATLRQADQKRIDELERAFAAEQQAHGAEIAELKERLQPLNTRRPRRSFEMMRYVAEMGAQAMAAKERG